MRWRYEHLLVLPVPFRQIGDEMHVEAQARHGLERWLDSFETLAVAAPVIPERKALEMRETRWVPMGGLAERVHLVPLPWAYRPDHFIRWLPSTVRVLDRLIAESRYLQFAIGGSWGDWAAVAAEVAIRRKRPYSVHTDSVIHEFVIRVSKNRGLRTRWKARLDAFLIRKWHKRIIHHCHLGLFHGMDTYEAYRVWMEGTGRGYVIHNIHDILDKNLDVQQSPVNQESHSTGNLKDDRLQILYAGRMSVEKAPEDWLRVVTRLRDRGVPFKAVWAGDGPLRDEFTQSLRREALDELVDAPGFIAERGLIGTLYRSADVFMFTHITRESPRCLLEALSFGIPIVGYESAFARDLIARHGGGVLVPCGDWAALSEAVAEIAADHSGLERLKRRAISDGERFSSRVVFLERSELIKTYLA
jgi:glycosyltransferase involved in cell wall biosynthesis